MSYGDLSLHDAGARGQRGWHACALLSGKEEEYRRLLPFAQHCFGCGDKCVHFVDPMRRQERLDRLASIPIDLDEASASGQLDLRTWEQCYLREGRFDQHAMLRLLDELLRAGQASFGRTRIWANMEWALSRRPGCEQLFEYESRINLMLEGRKDMILCVYDAREHDAFTLMNVLRTHPFVVVGDALRANALYIPTEQYLAKESRNRNQVAAPRRG
jgi:hypothetical protein